MARIVIERVEPSPTAAKPGQKVSVSFTLKNEFSEAKCFWVEIFWRQEGLAHMAGWINGNSSGNYTIFFYMPDKPEDPTKFSLNVYTRQGNPPICTGNIDGYPSYPSDFKVFEVDKIEETEKYNVSVRITGTEPLQPADGDTVYVIAKVTNNEQKSVTVDVNAKIGALVRDVETVTLSAGSSKDVKLNLGKLYKGDYNVCVEVPQASASDCTTLKVVERIERGLKVVVHDPPQSGILVVGVKFSLPNLIGIKVPGLDVEDYIPYWYEYVNEKTDVVLVPLEWYIPAGTPLGVLLYDNTGYRLYKKDTTAPSSGVRTVDVYGFGGAHYRTVTSASATSVVSGNPIKLSARLYKVPNTPMGEGYEINFYMRESGQSSWRFIGSNITNKDGVAVFQTVVTLGEGEDKKTYEFISTYNSENTYSEGCTVTVKRSAGGIMDAIAGLFNVSEEQARQIVIVLAILFILMLLLG